MARVVGSVLNVGSTDSPYYYSLVLEGLWGFTSEDFGGWVLMEPNQPILLYMRHRGVWGVWAEARLAEKFENLFPVSYWFKKPYERPFQVRLRYVIPERVDHESLDSITPLGRDELRWYGFHLDGRRRWEIKVFSEAEEIVVFERMWGEFRRRNAALSK